MREDRLNDWPYTLAAQRRDEVNATERRARRWAPLLSALATVLSSPPDAVMTQAPLRRLSPADVATLLELALDAVRVNLSRGDAIGPELDSELAGLVWDRIEEYETDREVANAER